MLKRVFGPVAGQLRDVAYLMRGASTYAKTKVTPQSAYESLIRMHCRTSGSSNDVLHHALKVCRPPYSLPDADGVLGDLSNGRSGQIAAEIARTGYYVFPERLPEATCDSLLEYALTTEAVPRPQTSALPPRARYERGNPLAQTYWFDEDVLVQSPDVQAIMADLSLLAVAQAYLGCQPVLDIVTMWWSTAFSKEASHEAAQLYHFDMDRIKWLKFFVYLTDVTPETGPHCFVAKSHRRNSQPKELLKRGYARIPDQDVRRFYPDDAFIEFLGPRGTIIAEDTRGYHKGKPVSRGDRLILEFEYCDTLFGNVYRKIPLKPDCSPALLERVRDYPRVYSKFTGT